MKFVRNLTSKYLSSYLPQTNEITNQTLKVGLAKLVNKYQTDWDVYLLPRPYLSTLSHLRSSHCSCLQSYLHKIEASPFPLCPHCLSSEQTTTHLFNCRTFPTLLLTSGNPHCPPQPSYNPTQTLSTFPSPRTTTTAPCPRTSHLRKITNFGCRKQQQPQGCRVLHQDTEAGLNQVYTIFLCLDGSRGLPWR